MTVATTCSTAARTPPKINGSDSGISTWVRICHSVMPLARAASMVCRSTDSRPAYAPASIEGIASTTKAMVAPTIGARL